MGDVGVQKPAFNAPLASSPRSGYLRPFYTPLHLLTFSLLLIGMRFSTPIIALTLAACTSALPASRNVVELHSREAGPSGYLAEPSGGTRYIEG